MRKRSQSTLPVSVVTTSDSSSSSFFSIFSWKKRSPNHDPVMVKGMIKEQIENLPEFKSRCQLDYKDLLIAKVDFNSYIALIKLTLKGGSNNEELLLRLAVDKCIRRNLNTVETTIEIDRI